MKTVKFVNETACFMVFEKEVNTMNIFVNELKLNQLNELQKEQLEKYCTSLVNHYNRSNKTEFFSNLLENIIDGQRVFIHSNGSKWIGEEPDSIDTLLNALDNYTLDPTFEEYGNFYQEVGNGMIKFFGNFCSLSHVFNILSLDHSVNEKLVNAINKNKNTDEYKKAKSELLKEVI